MPDSKGDRDRSPLRRDRRSRGGGGDDSRRKSRRAPPERRIFVSNIPFEMKWQEVKDMFREKVGDVTYVELFTDENDKPRGCGILEFDNSDLAKKAVEKMHRYELKGRKLVVKEDFDNERDKFGKIISSRSGTSRDRERGERRDRGGRDQSGPSNMSGGGFGNTYGLSPQFLDSLGIDGPLHTRLFVANLSYSVDERKLREVFRLAGRVVCTELNRDKDGKSRGHGVVEFNHPVEAVQAISMLNNQGLYDRKMTVRFDKDPGPTPEELDQLPSRLPEGLGNVGMGLGSGGNPLTNVAANLPSAQNNANNMMTNSMSNITELANTVGNIQAVIARSMGINMGGGGGGGGNMGASNMGGGNMGGGNMGGGNMGGGNMGGGNMGGGNMGGGNILPNTGNMGNIAGNLNNSIMGNMSGMAGGNMGSAGNMGSGMVGMNNPGGSLMGSASNMGNSSTPTAMLTGMNMSNSSSMGYSSGGGAGSGYGASSRNVGSMDNGGMTASTTGNRTSDTVIARNLPNDITWQELREGFEACGSIKYAEMKERGTGLIRFNSERDAERAVAMMDKQNIEGRPIDVRLY